MGCGHLRAWVLLTAAVSHPRLTSKLQHTPDGTQKVSTQGAQMLLRTLLTYLYGIQFPFRGTHGHFSYTLQGCFNFVMMFLLGSLLLKQRTLSKAFIDSEEMHGGRCCLRQSKCCITGSRVTAIVSWKLLVIHKR